MNKQKAQSSEQTSTTSKPITLQDVEGVTVAGNDLGSSQINLTDGGAISGSLDLSRDVVAGAAELTLGILDRQMEMARQAFEGLKSGQENAQQFAMDAGRSDVSTIQKWGVGLFIVAAIIAAGWALKGAS